ncbi:MAG TPA: hypothetical protein VK504_32300 [Vicinamibacterales bacterium]|nr:hypothetical protein [Vicinamibacterales bacterium]
MRIIGDMGRFADEVLERIARARRRVDVECFIVRDDRLGHALAGALSAAVARGVACPSGRSRLSPFRFAAADFELTAGSGTGWKAAESSTESAAPRGIGGAVGTPLGPA